MISILCFFLSRSHYTFSHIKTQVAILYIVIPIKGRDHIKEIPYDREAAVAYAHKWAYARNPLFYNFDNEGGDCTNFASQVLFAGSKAMNFTPLTGWYYKTAYDRSPSWTGVRFLADFLLKNKTAGPYGTVCGLSELLPGDIIQIATVKDGFHHTPVVVGVSGTAIFVAAHTLDCDYRPLSSYQIKKIRPIHILGCRKP